jgi:long-chain acyl-CoA synthetase
LEREIGKEAAWLSHYDAHVPDHLEYPVLTINEMMAQAIERYPEQPFLLFHDGRLTYRQVGDYLHTLSQNLLGMGLLKGQHVAILLPNIPQFVLAYYAVLYAGGGGAALTPICVKRN